MLLNSENRGGGSGGGGDDDGPNIIKSADGAYEIAGSQVVLFSRPTIPPPDVNDKDAKDGPYVITLLAAGNMATNKPGKVDIRGNQKVRITSGSAVDIPVDLSPQVSTDGTLGGIELIAAEDHDISIQRGCFEITSTQRIEMMKNSIIIDAGDTGTITLQAGENSIVISATEGITICSNTGGVLIVGIPAVDINPGPPLPPPPPLPDVMEA